MTFRVFPYDGTSSLRGSLANYFSFTGDLETARRVYYRFRQSKFQTSKGVPIQLAGLVVKELTGEQYEANVFLDLRETDAECIGKLIAREFGEKKDKIFSSIKKEFKENNLQPLIEEINPTPAIYFFNGDHGPFCLTRLGKFEDYKDAYIGGHKGDELYEGEDLADLTKVGIIEPRRKMLGNVRVWQMIKAAAQIFH
ncbi:hypothetical protein CL616_04790 [archaeon]|nr:hypothetical protein [archaeon]|tara:strand:+ start:2049 stop:2639 length:591 start_codon:yes stop_codon:yes gene_type:complete